MERLVSGSRRFVRQRSAKSRSASPRGTVQFGGRITRRRAYIAQKRKYLVPFDKLLGIGLGSIWLVTVVERLENQHAAVYAALAVDIFEISLDSSLHLRAQRLRGTTEGGGLANQNGAIGYTLRKNGKRCKSDHKKCRVEK